MIPRNPYLALFGCPLHLVTGNDSQFSRKAAAQFEYSGNRLARHNGCGGIRDCVVGDALNGAVCAHENNVQGDDGVLHPETCDTRLWKGKNQAHIVGEFRAEHEPPSLLCCRSCCLNGEAMRFGGADHA